MHSFSFKQGALIILSIAIIASFSFGALYRIKQEPVTKTQYIMGTLVEISAFGKNPEPAIEAAFGRMRAIEGQVGHDESSDISRLNELAGKSGVTVGADTWKMLQMAAKYAKLTAGAFDVTVGPLVELWGFGYDGEGFFPEASEIANAMPRVGSDKIIFSPGKKSIKLAKPGMSLTIGGVAKGYAVEAATRELQKYHITNAMVNGGSSSIKVIGSGPSGHGWRVGIEDPRNRGKLLGVVTLKSGEALGTSADNKRFFLYNGRRYSHIIDPRTGYPTGKGIALVTVVTNNATKADILTKALFLNVPKWSINYLKQQRMKGIIVKTDGKILTTPGFKLDL